MQLIIKTIRPVLTKNVLIRKPVLMNQISQLTQGVVKKKIRNTRPVSKIVQDFGPPTVFFCFFSKKGTHSPKNQQKINIQLRQYRQLVRSLIFEIFADGE